MYVHASLDSHGKKISILPGKYCQGDHRDEEQSRKCAIATELESFEFGEWALKIPPRRYPIPNEVDGRRTKAGGVGSRRERERERKNVAAGQGAPQQPDNSGSK